MNAARPRRLLGVWLVWVGGFCCVLSLGFVVAWWKLPQWAPELVIKHSPWLQPGARALIAQYSSGFGYSRELFPVLKWGPRIASYFVTRFPVAELDERSTMLSLATEVGERVLDSEPDPSKPAVATPAEQERVRSDLRTLVDLALADGRSYLPHGALSIARLLKAYDLAPDFARRLTSAGLDKQFLHFISESRDPRNLEYLVPLLRGTEYRTDVLHAIAACFTADSTGIVVYAAQNATPTIRAWAMEVTTQVTVDATLRKLVVELIDDPVTDVRVAAITAAGAARFEEAAPRLLALIQTGQVMALRHAAVDALGRMGSRAHAPLLRELADRPQEPLRGVAISALGWLADPEDYPRLLALLRHEDDDLARKARIAVERLPLKTAQRQAVDAAWKARDGEEPLDDSPTASPVTSPLPTASPANP